MINHHVLAPGPLKPLKSSPGGQNLPGVLFRDHGGPPRICFSPGLPQKMMSWPLK